MKQGMDPETATDCSLGPAVGPVAMDEDDIAWARPSRPEALALFVVTGRLATPCAGPNDIQCLCFYLFNDIELQSKLTCNWPPYRSGRFSVCRFTVCRFDVYPSFVVRRGILVWPEADI